MTTFARFTPTFLYLLSAMIIWIIFFMGSYGLIAVICAVGLPWASPGLAAHLSLGAATLLALGATTMLLFQARRRTETASGDARFVEIQVVLQCVAAVIAIAWNALPLVFLEGCGLQELPQM